MPKPTQFEHKFSTQEAADNFLEFERLATMRGFTREEYINLLILGELETMDDLLKTKTVTESGLIDAMAEAEIKGANRNTVNKVRSAGEMDRPEGEPRLYYTAGSGSGKSTRVIYNLEECLAFFRDREKQTQNNSEEIN